MLALTTVIDDKRYWLGFDVQIAETLCGHKQYEIVLHCCISQIETQATSPWKEMLSDKVSSDLDDFFIWLSISTGDWKVCSTFENFPILAIKLVSHIHYPVWRAHCTHLGSPIVDNCGFVI